MMRHSVPFIAISLSFNWNMRQLDIKNAFLHGHLKETVYMERPPGFIDSTFPDCVCLLKKSLYGLKQAPRAQFDRLSQFLLHLGFYCSKADSSLCIYRTNNIITVLLIYVDDILVGGTMTSLLQVSLSNLVMSLQLKIWTLYIFFLVWKLHSSLVVFFFLNISTYMICLQEQRCLIAILLPPQVLTVSLQG